MSRNTATPPAHGPPPRLLVGRALLGRCPVCGGGGLFRRWFSMVDACPRCGLVFERIEGHWIGSLGLNTIVTFATLFAVLLGGVILSWPDIPVVALSVAGVAAAVVVPLAFFPVSRTLWTAIDLWMRPLGAHEAPFLTSARDDRPPDERVFDPRC